MPQINLDWQQTLWMTSCVIRWPGLGIISMTSGASNWYGVVAMSTATSRVLDRHFELARNGNGSAQACNKYICNAPGSFEVNPKGLYLRKD